MGTETADVKGIHMNKYTMDDAMWRNEDTNGNNHKYRFTGPDYLMEMSSTNGVPTYISKPYLIDFEDTSHISVNGDYDASTDYASYLYVEPLTGVPMKAEIKAQVNFGVHNKMLDRTTLFNNAMSNGLAVGTGGFETTIVPFFWVDVSPELTDDQAADFVDALDTIDDVITVALAAAAMGGMLITVGIIILVLGCLGIVGGVASGGGSGVAPEK